MTYIEIIKSYWEVAASQHVCFQHEDRFKNSKVNYRSRGYDEDKAEEPQEEEERKDKEDQQRGDDKMKNSIHLMKLFFYWCNISTRFYFIQLYKAKITTK